MMNSKSRGFLATVLMLALVAFLALPASAFAQRHGRRRAATVERRAESHGDEQLRQRAKTTGYNSGKQAGINDHKRGEPSNFRDEKDYQRATKGYSPKLGSKALYGQVFREAFENGYNDGYNGY